MTITAEFLKKQKAPSIEMDEFRLLWPEGAPVTVETVLTLMDRDLWCEFEVAALRKGGQFERDYDAAWEARRRACCTPSAQLAFRHAIAHAWVNAYS